MSFEADTPREEALSIAINYVEYAVRVHARDADSRRENAVVRQLMKLENQLRRKLRADPNPAYDVD